MRNDRHILKKTRLVVVKLGSGILSRKGGELDLRQIQHFAEQVAVLRKKGCKVLLVSSGAVSAGMGRLGIKRRPTSISDLQTCAAVGQNLLMARYEHAFTRNKLTVAQILLTYEDLRDSIRRKNTKHTLLNLLKKGIVPIINENDAVSFEELKFGDNDQLAAMVHKLVGAHVCIILSNIDGFISSRTSKVISVIPKITSEIKKQAGGSNSHRSVGGMRSKLIAARRVLVTGKPLVIANGRLPRVLPRLLSGESLGTIFLP